MVGPLAAAQAAKAGATIVSKPVFGKKKFVVYEQELELKDGQKVKAQVVEETDLTIPAWGAVLGGILALAGIGTAAAVATGVVSGEKLDEPHKSRAEKQAEKDKGDLFAHDSLPDRIGDLLTGKGFF